ncbi:MAG: DMT family transporter [Chloroflexi bacterium]|nr:DMT family transporter [Chloroflexota bacterium]
MLAVLAAAVLWSSGGLFIKLVSLDALALTMWRSLLAGATIALFTRCGLPDPRRAGRLTWALAVSYALMLVLFVSATKLTTAANAIFLQYTAPLYVLVLSAVFIAERPSRTDLACVAVAFGGMALFFVGRLQADDLGGNLSALGSGAAFAVFLTLLRAPSCGDRTRPRAMVLGNLLLVAGLAAVNLGRGSAAAFTPGLTDFAGIAVLGVLQIGLAYVLFGFGIAHVQALEASLIGMLEPVLNPVWVFLALGERPGWWAAAGGVVIVGAVAVRTLLSERGRSAAAREPLLVHAEA